MQPRLYGFLTLTLLLISLPTTASAAALDSVTVNPTSVTGGSSVTVTVRLSGKFLRGGAEITLSSDKGGAAHFASGGGASLRVTMPENRDWFGVRVDTSHVTQPVTVTISATYAGVVKTAPLQVNPVSPYPSGILFAPNPVRGGDPVTATVFLNDPAPSGGLTIPLSSSTVATTPPSITIPPGAKSASFTFNAPWVVGVGTAQIFPPGVGLTILPACPAILLTPNPVLGGRSVSGAVVLNGPVPSNQTWGIKLSTSSTYVAVPAIIHVPGGATSATFTVTTAIPTVSISVQVFAACGIESGLRASSTLVVTVY